MMTTAREDAAKVELGKAIQQRNTSVNKQIDRLVDELNNIKSKAVNANYTPDGMPDVSIPIDALTKVDMITLGTAIEARLRTVTDDLKAFLDSATG